MEGTQRTSFHKPEGGIRPGIYLNVEAFNELYNRAGITKLRHRAADLQCSVTTLHRAVARRSDTDPFGINPIGFKLKFTILARFPRVSAKRLFAERGCPDVAATTDRAAA